MSMPEPKEEVPPELPLPPGWQQPAAPEPPAVRRAPNAAVMALVGLLLVVIAGVAASPFWAPAVAPLLPWGERATVAPADAETNNDADQIRDLQARLDGTEAALKQQAAQLQKIGAQATALKQQTATQAPAAKTAPPNEGQLMRLDGDEQILRDMADRITALEARPVPPKQPAVPVQSPQSAAAIKALQDQIAKLTTGTATMGDRLTKLQTALTQANANDRANHALLLALANLRVAAAGSGPYAADLAATQALADGNGAMKERLATLGGNAKTGLPSTAALAQQFDRSVAPAILRAPRNVKNEGWWQQIRARLERLVVIRRVAADGAMPRDPTEAAVARADMALRAGDLAAAVAALQPLTGTAAKAAAPWLAQAKRRVAAEATLANLWHDAVANAGAKP